MGETYRKSMKRNDTGSPLKGRILNTSDGEPLDLTNVTITFLMYAVDDDGVMTELVNSAATVTDAEEGEFQYNWAVGDTSTVGTHLGAFQLIFTAESNRKETYPSSGWIDIEIQPDLENA
jgi:hypothetical protein